MVVLVHISNVLELQLGPVGVVDLYRVDHPVVKYFPVNHPFRCFIDNRRSSLTLVTPSMALVALMILLGLEA